MPVNSTMEKSSKPAADRFSQRRALLCALPFFVMAAVALVLGLYGLFMRQLDARAGKHLLTIIVVCVGVPMFIIGWFAGKRVKPSVQLKASHPEQPWRWREDWAAGRVDTSVRPSVFFLWVFVLFFDLFSLVALWVVWQEVRAGSLAEWLALIFPFIGVVVFAFALRTARVWGRFGRAAFNVNALPAWPGAVLAGEIVVPARLRPETAFYLRLSCVRHTSALRKNQRVITERTLWQEERWLRPNLPQTTENVTRLPIFFTLPAGMPATTTGDGDGVQWRLEASAKVSGPDFHGLFELPVYAPGTKPVGDVATGDTMAGIAPAPVAVAAAVPEVAPADPTAVWQLTLDEVRKAIHSRIQVKDTPAGREILFPAGRNPGFIIGAAVIWLIWTGVIGLMVCVQAPVVVPLVFAALDCMMTFFLADLWLRSNWVWVTPTQVTLRTSWLGYKKETVLAAAEVASLKVDVGAHAGHAAYYDLKIFTRKGREHLVAKFLSHKPEADWLIRQLAEPLKRG